MRCPNCGESNDDTDTHCRECKEPLPTKTPDMTLSVEQPRIDDETARQAKDAADRRAAEKDDEKQKHREAEEAKKRTRIADARAKADASAARLTKMLFGDRDRKSDKDPGRGHGR